MDKRKTVVADMYEVCESPLAELVHIACQFQSRILLRDGSREFNAKSIMGIMAMNLTEGMTVELEAEGTDEAEAAKAVENFLTGKHKVER